MPGPTQLNVKMAYTGNPVITVPISAALQSLDTGSGQASQQTGYSSADIAIRNIFRAGCFTDGAGNWYSAAQIQSITYQ
jgi:hypothetical protein